MRTTSLTWLRKGKESQFPECFTIDEEGLMSLCYFLKKEFGGENVIVSIKIEQAIKELEK